MEIKQLTPQEEQVMRCFWEKGTSTVRGVMPLLAQTDIPYTTVASTVANLKKKGYLTATQSGNAYIYTPALSEDAYKSAFMTGFVRDYFAGSYKDVVSFFAQEEKISSKDLEEILRLIEDGGDSAT